MGSLEADPENIVPTQPQMTRILDQELANASMGRRYIYLLNSHHVYIFIYLEHKWGPLFWLEFGPCFGGLTFKNKGHWGSRYTNTSTFQGVYVFPNIYLHLVDNNCR